MPTLPRAFVSAALILLACPVAHATTELRLVTRTGFVAFAADESWQVVHTDTRPEAQVRVFQIPNPADAGTPHSTNVVVTVIDPDSKDADRLIDAVGTPVGIALPKQEQHADWTVWSQQGRDGDTVYELRDARREVAGAIATVRWAWPRLAANPPDYDARMDVRFRLFLDSVYGKIAPSD